MYLKAFRGRTSDDLPYTDTGTILVDTPCAHSTGSPSLGTQTIATLIAVYGLYDAARLELGGFGMGLCACMGHSSTIV